MLFLGGNLGSSRQTVQNFVYVTKTKIPFYFQARIYAEFPFR